MLRKSIVAGVVAGALSCGALMADVVTLTKLGETTRVVRVFDPSNLEGASFNAGSFQMQDNGTTFDAFCVDIDITILDSWNYLRVDAPYSPIPQATTPGRAWDGLGWDAASWLVQKFVPENRDQAAGLQLAIWEVLYDDDLSLASAEGSKFWATADRDQVINAANAYLAAVPAAIGDGVATWWMPIAGSAEDILVAAESINRYAQGGSQGLISRVPVPDGGITLLLLGLGFTGLSLIQRRSAKA